MLPSGLKTGHGFPADMCSAPSTFDRPSNSESRGLPEQGLNEIFHKNSGSNFMFNMIIMEIISWFSEEKVAIYSIFPKRW